MYKVFVNDKPIIFTTSLKNEENYIVFIYKDTIIEELVYKLKMDKLKGVYLYTLNLADDWQRFKLNFIGVTAAGGLVLNDKKEILFIYRGTKWELPKGRREKGESLKETAIREVEEECGVTNLIIKKELTKTYHFFIQNGKYKIKETTWFLMYSSYKGKTTPQTEEGITRAVFKDNEATKKALQNTFSNIVTVCKQYKKV